jgi:hypothetical protein
MRNVSTIVHKHDFSTSGTYKKLRVIPSSGRHHLPKFAIGQESPPPPSPLKKGNPAKKNQRASDSMVNKKSK